MKFIIIRVGDDLIFFEREHVSDIMVLKGETKEQLLKSRIRDEEEKETEIQEEYSVAIGIDGRQSYKVFTGSLSNCISFITDTFGPIKSLVTNFEKFLKDTS
jgi:hypothetical protein